MKEKVFVFDFDGVIADSFGFHLKHLQEYTGLMISEEEYKEMSLGNFHMSSWYRENKEKLDGYEAYLAQHAVKALIYEGMYDIVRECAAQGMCYIISSGSEGHIKDFLARYKMEHFFGSRIWGAQTHWSKVVKLERIREERLDPEIVFVADTRGDIEEGMQAKVETVAVTWGFHDRKILIEASPDMVCDTIEELERVLKLRN